MSTSSQLMIAIAEDDDDLRELWVDALQRDGHRVIELEDGFELLDYVQFVERLHSPPGLPDLILTDVRMPGVNGVAAVERARAAGVTCPIIVLTAFPDAAVEAHCASLHDVTLVAKPAELDEIRQRVRAIGLRTRV